MRAPIGLAVVLAATAACTVPDKFYDDAGVGDDAVDAGADADPNDEDPPETTITAAPPAVDDAGTAAFEFEADEDATFTCAIDGETPVDCTSPYSRALADGPHSFAVRATDLAGNSDDTPAEHVWQIDTVAPDTTITTAPAAVDNSVDISFEFTADESPVTFECRLDGAAFAACTSPQPYTGMTEGAHTFEVRAIDPAGNVDGTPATHAWTIDLSAPDTTIDTGPTGAVASASATFTFSSPDAGAGATFECSLDGGAFATCTSPRMFTGLSETSHTFEVRVRDSGGNVDPTPATRTWTVDVTPPNTGITGGPTGPVASTSASFQLTSNEAPVTFQCNLDGGGFAACPATYQLTGLAQGAHSLAVRAVDAAGNVDGSPATRSWTVDTVGPTITITSGPANNGTSGPYVTFAFTVSEGTPSCTLDGGQPAPCTSPISFSLPQAAHTFRIEATDALGNPGSIQRGWSVVCGPATGGPGGAGLFHMDEAQGQAVVNSIAGLPDAQRGGSIEPDASDPDLNEEGRYGRGYRFTASQRDYVLWNAGQLGGHDHTIEVWAVPVLSEENDLYTTGVPAVGGPGRVRLWWASSDGVVRVVYTIVDDQQNARSVSSGQIPLDRWAHIVATFDAQNTMTLWVNGEAYTGSASVSQNLSWSTHYFGHRQVSLNGYLDEVYFGTQAMTPTQVLNRYCPL